MIGFVSWLLVCASALAESENNGWILDWEEDFSGDAGNKSRWTKTRRGTPHWQMYMSPYDELFEVRDSCLRLTGLKNTMYPTDPAPYLDAGLTTEHKVTFGFGKLEIRARFTNCSGAWPAFWLLPEGGPSWPDGGEIDLVERLNHEAVGYQTVHSYYTDRLHMHVPKDSSHGAIDPTGWNTYTMEKYEGLMRFFINDVPTFNYPRIQTDKKGQYPFDREYFLMLDMQLGGDWVGPIKDSELPAYVYIDWVRHYKGA
jgi:beta-glucanase (GH16 family)